MYMPLHLIRQDITKMDVDVIVNAANEQLHPGGGVCGAIYQAAGYDKLKEATDALKHCPVGQTVVTPAFDLEAKYIFHTVGPIWQGGENQEALLLISCYQTALQKAVDLNCESIALPLISSGSYGYPKTAAFYNATSTIEKFIETHELTVYLVLFDQPSIPSTAAWKNLLTEYIDEHYVEEQKKASFNRSRFRLEESAPFVSEVKQMQESFIELNLDLAKLEDTFQQRLFRWIDTHELNEVDVYKKANISRKHFSKIRSNIDYQPKKNTVLAFAIALELSLDDTLDLLRCAGFTLSNSKKFDVIVRFFIEREIYSIYTINEALFDAGEETIN